jgi:hypothetical protein
MYPANDKVAKNVLKDLATLPIVNIGKGLIFPQLPQLYFWPFSENREGGTQIKLIMHYGLDIKALVKPRRLNREDTVQPNQFYFDELERHNAEIAAYHLDK